MVAKFFSVLIFLGVICPGSIWGQINDSAAGKLRKAVAEFMNKHKSPSVVVAVVHENDIVFFESMGYTDIGNKVPATIDSKYPIMSITKTFTATMLMKLVEQGVVRLDDDVRKYIPEYKVQSDFPGSGVTTLFQLATHASGLPRNTPADINFTLSYDRLMLGDGKDSIQPFSTNKELLRSLQFLKLDYPPFHYVHHNDRHYSNLGYSVLGIAIERAAKVSFPKYVTGQICKPLQMMSTGFLTEPGINDQVAKGYRYDKSTNTTMRIPPFQINAAIYPGGMYSTARDMATYISSQFNDNKVLSTNNRAMMNALKIGWKPAYPYVLHEGGFPGYRSIVVFNPDSKIGWVILTNSGDIDFNQVSGQIAETVSAAYRKPVMPGLTKYVGTYRLPGGYDSLTIVLKNDTLYSTYCRDVLHGQPMKADGEHRFRVDGMTGHTINYEFVADKNAGITRLRMGQLVWYRK